MILMQRWPKSNDFNARYYKLTCSTYVDQLKVFFLFLIFKYFFISDKSGVNQIKLVTSLI